MKLTDLPAEFFEKVPHLVAALGDTELPEPTGYHILVLQYVRPPQSKGGLIMPEKVVREDVYQGRVGLVLKLGPTAYADKARFTDAWCKPGDWIIWPSIEGAARRFSYGENVTLAMITDDTVLATNMDPLRATLGA